MQRSEDDTNPGSTHVLAADQPGPGVSASPKGAAALNEKNEAHPSRDELAATLISTKTNLSALVKSTLGPPQEASESAALDTRSNGQPPSGRLTSSSLAALIRFWENLASAEAEAAESFASHFLLTLARFRISSAVSSEPAPRQANPSGDLPPEPVPLLVEAEEVSSESQGDPGSDAVASREDASSHPAPLLPLRKASSPSPDRTSEQGDGSLESRASRHRSAIPFADEDATHANLVSTSVQLQGSGGELGDLPTSSQSGSQLAEQVLSGTGFPVLTGQVRRTVLPDALPLPQAMSLLVESVDLGITVLERTVGTLVEPMVEAQTQSPDFLYWLGVSSWLLAATLAAERVRHHRKRQAMHCPALPLEPYCLRTESYP
jgi:hypothetical protein